MGRAVISFLAVEAAIFLDRDNTLIENDDDLGDPDGVHLCPGVSRGLQELRNAGYRLVVVTNQGGVARGAYSEADVDAVHQRIAALVDETSNEVGLIERFYYCPFHPEADLEEYRRDHSWRKPHPGMLIQAAHDMQLDLARSWMIGDQARDVQAGRSAGCRTALVNPDEKISIEAKPTYAGKTFPEAVDFILKQKTNAPEAPANMNGQSTSLASPESTPLALSNATNTDSDVGMLRRTIHDLTEELRSERMRRAEFTPLKMAASFCQLLAVLLAMLGLLQVGGELEVFTKWMIGAGLMQLMTMTMLLLDLKG